VPDRYAAPYLELGMDEEGARFYGMIACIDERIGELRERLKEWDLEENTILIFMTDNGNGGPPSSRKGKFGYDGGMRAFKGSHYDGGHRVPCFIRWPKGGLAGGRDVARLAAHFDLLPTLADLCGLKFEPRHPLDGRSLAPLLRGDGAGWPERTLFVHHQRVETPVKGRNWVAMTGRWRLIDGRELYDIQGDPAQKNDVAAAHPEVVGRLHAAYDTWWDSISSRFGEFCEVVIGSGAENPVKLTCHDWHSDGQLQTWDPAVIDRGVQGNGFWSVDVARAGRYSFRLQMLPDEAAGRRPFAAHRVRMAIGDHEIGKDIGSGDTSVTLNATLEAGKTRMQTWLEGGAHAGGGAPFVYVEYLGR
jgi:hypothetical protein